MPSGRPARTSFRRSMRKPCLIKSESQCPAQVYRCAGCGTAAGTSNFWWDDNRGRDSSESAFIGGSPWQNLGHLSFTVAPARHGAFTHLPSKGACERPRLIQKLKTVTQTATSNTLTCLAPPLVPNGNSSTILPSNCRRNRRLQDADRTSAATRFLAVPHLRGLYFTAHPMRSRHFLGNGPIGQSQC